MTGPAQAITPEEQQALFDKLSNWGRWGADDERGALNLITPRKLIQASELVIEGTSVSCALPLNTQGSSENPRPVVHLMVGAGDTEGATSSSDYFAIASHGMAHTHLDALCHVFHRGQMYNGRPASQVTSAGTLANSIESGKNGIVSRGVLLDIPRALGKDWLEPGEAIFPEDLEAAEKEHGLQVDEGDILLVRTGRWKRRQAAGAAQGIPGLDSSALAWLHGRGVALLGCDGVSDVVPSGMPGGRGMPIHTVGITSMGLHLLDNASLDDLADECTRLDRWEFMLTIAPLKLQRGTASPVNPIAVF